MNRKALSLAIAAIMTLSITTMNTSYGAVKSNDNTSKILKKKAISPKEQLQRSLNFIKAQKKDSAKNNPYIQNGNIKLMVKNDGQDINNQLINAGAKVINEIGEGLYNVTIAEADANKLLSIGSIKDISVDRVFELDPVERKENTKDVSDPEVITPNLETTLDDTKADVFRNNFGYDGTGVKIAILDTGVDPNHEMLRNTTTGNIKIVDWQDFTGEGNVSTTKTANVNENKEIDVTGFSKNIFKVPENLNKDQKVYIGAINEQLFLDLPKPSELPEFNFNGVVEKFPILITQSNSTTYDQIYVDTDLDNDFSDETALKTYKVGVANGERNVAHFPRLDGGPKDAVVNFVLTKISEKNGKISLNIGFDGGEHGTHVAGIASGNGSLTGVAPGANIMALKVLGSHGSGSTSGIINAMIYAAQNGADVVNMSLGSSADINDGTNLEAQYADQLTAKYGTIFCISAGNNGPGINSIGTPGDADSAITSGAYIESKTWQVDYDADVPGEGLWRFSSIGPNENGAIKPTIITPGSALSSVPVWDNLYTNTPGYAVYQGTSMSSPHTTGLVGLLTQAARKNKVTDNRLNINLVQEALQETGRKLQGLQVAEQGGGLVDVVKAFDYIKAKSAASKYSIDVNTSYSEKLDYSTGIFIRNNNVPQKVIVELTNNENKNIKLNISKSQNVTWYNIAKKDIVVPAKGKAQFEVSFNNGIKPGLYSDLVKIDSSDTVLIDARLPITIANKQELSRDDLYTTNFKGELKTSKYDRNFINVPIGTKKIEVELRAVKNAQGQLGTLRSIVFNPDGMQEFDSYSEIGYIGVGSKYTTYKYEIVNPKSGNWEFNTFNNWTNGNKQKAAYGTASNTGAYEMTIKLNGIIANPDNFTAEVKTGASVVKNYKFTNLTGKDRNIKVEPTKLIDLLNLPKPEVKYLKSSKESGADFYDFYYDPITITADDPNFIFNISVASKDYPDSDDFDLYLQRKDGDSWTTIASCADGDADESISLTGLTTGEYRVKIENFAIWYTPTTAKDPTIVVYTKQIVNASSGSLDAKLQMNSNPIAVKAGDTWTAIAKFTAPNIVTNYGGLILIKDADTNEVLVQLPVNISTKLSNGGSKKIKLSLY